MSPVRYRYVEPANATDCGVPGKWVAIEAADTCYATFDFRHIGTFSRLRKLIATITPFLDESLDHYAAVRSAVFYEIRQEIRLDERLYDEVKWSHNVPHQRLDAGRRAHKR